MVMEEGEGEREDQFGWLIKFCLPTSSQELKLQKCSFARESEIFPDYLDSLGTSSPEPTPLEPEGIIIVSPPQTESGEISSTAESNSQENEIFLNPPEHSNAYVVSSSQEDRQRMRLFSSGDSKVSVSVVAETIAGESGRVENKGSIDMGERGGTLGFSGTDQINSCGEVLEGQSRDGVDEVVRKKDNRRDLRIFMDFLNKLNEPGPESKKHRVLEGNRNSRENNLCIVGSRINDRQNVSEIIDLDTQEIDEGNIIDVDKDFGENGEVREHGEPCKNVQEVSDTSTERVEDVEETEKCDSDGNVDQREKEKSVDLDGGDKCLKVNGYLTPEASEEGDGDNTNSEAQRDGKAASDIGIRWKFKCRSGGNGVDSSSKEGVERDRHELPSSVEEKDTGEKEGNRNPEEIQNSCSDSDIDEREKEKGVMPSRGGKRKKYGKLPLAGSEGRIKDKRKSKVRKDGKAVLGSNSGIEEIEKFRYELPSSLEDKDMGENGSIENSEKVQKSKNSRSRDIDEKENGITFNGVGKRLKGNGTLALAESEGRTSHNNSYNVHRDGQTVLGRSSIEKIETFRYEGHGKEVDDSAKGRSAGTRRELPPSITGIEKDTGGEENRRRIKVKSGSWKDLLDALEEVFTKVDDGCEDVDFLKTAQSRGLTFPQPRWI